MGAENPVLFVCDLQSAGIFIRRGVSYRQLDIGNQGGLTSGLLVGDDSCRSCFWLD
jgi:hypothetical protein